MSSSTPQIAVLPSTKPVSLAVTVVAGALLLTFTSGCSTKNYVKSQTAPLVDQTNSLDAKTANDHRAILDTDDRAQKGIAKAQGSADTADQHAIAAGQSADAADLGARSSSTRT